MTDIDTKETARRRSPAIHLRSVSKSYQQRKEASDLQVIDKLDFSVRPGELLTVVGPSGCGKSTILRLIAGLTAVTGGTIEFEPANPRIGFVFQDYSNALAPWRTVLRNVEFGLEIEGRVSKADRTAAARQYLELVGLSGFESAYPRELSGGMQQRVQLARVLAYEPDLLLMDEPFGSLDAQMRRILQEEVKTILSRIERTVLFVTHDIEESLYLGDRIVVLGSRPASVIAEFELEARPNDFNEFVSSSVFQENHRRVWALLHHEKTDV